jgi:hypothetical protein
VDPEAIKMEHEKVRPLSENMKMMLTYVLMKIFIHSCGMDTSINKFGKYFRIQWKFSFYNTKDD